MNADHPNVKLSLEAKQAIFLATLAKTGMVQASLEAAEWSRSSAFKLAKADTEFQAKWDAALDTFADKLEKELIRRAEEGVEKPVYYKGEVVGYITEYSDSLLLAAVKAKRREYRDQGKLELGNVPGEDFRVSESPTQLGRKLAFALAVAARAASQAAEDGSDLA